jgi:translation elongation factor EF-1alpha
MIEFTTEQLEKLNKQREINRYKYLGLLSEYQTVSNKLVQKIIYTELNTQQLHLYKRVLHGLNAFTPEELEKMHWDKKRRIKKVWKRAQNVINTLKQKICNKRSNEILSVFSSSKLAKDIMSVPVEEVDQRFINKMSFRTLGVKPEDLIIKFYAEGLLPKNYFELK